MIYFWVILALVLLAIAAVLFLETKLIIEYRDKKVMLKIRNLFLRLTIDSDKLSKMRGEKKTEEKDTSKSEEKGIFERIAKLKEKYDSVRDIVNIFARCLKDRVSMSKIEIYIKYGTGDACTTGMAYGAIWTLISNIYSFLCRHFYITFPDVKIDAQFDGGPMFETRCYGIIKLRFVHIIIAAVRSYKSYKKHKK